MPRDNQEGFLEGILISKFSITVEQVEQAKKLNINKLGLLTNLQKMGALSDKQCVDIEGLCFKTHVIRLKAHVISKELLDTIAIELRTKYKIIPVAKQGNILTVATSSLLESQQVLPEIQKTTNCLINFVLAYPTDISERLGELSGSTENMDEMLQSKAKQLNVATESIEDELLGDPNGPVAQVINHLLSQAVTVGASDIHLECFPQTMRIRFREDGVLREVKTFDKVFIAPFTAAIKVMSGLDIAETRIPQDGAIHSEIAGRKIDFRVATYPTDYGEKIVLRILDSNKDWLSIDSLQLAPPVKKQLIEIIESPEGLILCAGPTGSGKTSTLYAILKHLNNVTDNVLTIEDPVEYRMTGVTQGQVNSKKGFTFATALRAMLRLDPDVILVGEMRDKETAEIGAQAALTGHLVLSTIHTNSASQTMARLIDIGVEKFVVASALRGVISQRLLRKVCSKCKETYTPTEQMMKDAGFRSPYPKELFRGKGCFVCHNDGYKGRIPVLELLVVHNDMRTIISNNADPGELFQSAINHGMWTIHDDAVEKAKQGLTTAEEIVRSLGPAKLEEVDAEKKAA